MTDGRGDPVPVVADALARHKLYGFWSCVCGERAATLTPATLTWHAAHQAEVIVERLYGEGLLAYGVGKQEEG